MILAAAANHNFGNSAASFRGLSSFQPGFKVAVLAVCFIEMFAVTTEGYTTCVLRLNGPVYALEKNLLNDHVEIYEI